MPGDAREATARLAAILATVYNALSETSVSLAVAAQMGHVPPDPEAVRDVRGDLESTRRLLQQCLLYVDAIESSVLSLDEDDADLP